MTSRTISRALCAAALGAVLAGCAGDPAPLFIPTGTGTVAGQVFYDADNNNIFTPVGGDSALAGVRVELRERASTRVIAAATTDAQGGYSFAGVPAGTHDVFVVPSDATTGALLFCVNPRTASVYLGEQAYHQVPAKIGCVIRIRAAKEEEVGARVTVAGVVTAAQGTYRGDNVYISDVTGGIQIFGIPSALNLQVGDSLEVSGQIGLFNREIQVVSPRVAPNIARGVGSPDPVVTTTSAIAQGVAASGARSPLVGQLLTVTAQVGPFIAGNPPRNAPLDGGPVEMRLDGNVVNSLPSTFFTPNSCYRITGILGLFNAIAQIKPRGPADVQEVPCP